MSATSTSEQGLGRLRALSWGLAGTLAIVVLVALVNQRELARVQADVERLTRRAEHSTYLIGNIGRQTSRVRANTLMALLRPPSDLPILSQLILRLNTDMDSNLDELPQVLGEAERAVWSRRVAPELRRLRSRLERAQRMLENGRREETRQFLDVIHEETQRFFGVWDSFAQLHEQATTAAFDDSRQRLNWTRLVGGVSSIVIVLASMLIWLAVMRIIVRQRQEISDQISRLQSRNADLDAFAGRIAHDINGALSPIIMGATLLREDTAQLPGLQPLAVKIEAASFRAAGLVEALLAFSRAGRPPQSPGTTRVSDVLRTVLQDQEGLRQKVRAEIHSEVSPVACVSCQPGLLQIVLSNVVSNALKYLEGCAVRRVDLFVHEEASWCVIRVSDTGPGIPADSVGHVFEPFYRVPGNTVAGTGIGLATVRRVVESHGGQIGVESTVGKGTRFTLWLPGSSASPGPRA